MSDTQMIQSREHPHYGEMGWIDREQKQETTGQFYFKLSNCQHGKAGCYVTESDITQTHSESKPLEGELLPPDPNLAATKYSPEIEKKLSDCFEDDMNISEACRESGIHRDTYYDWLERIPGFSDRMEWAKGATARLARKTARRAIKAGDPATARWYLDRKDPEFKPKSEVDNTHQLQQTRKKIKDFLDEPTDYDSSESDAASSEPPAADAPAGDQEVASTTPDIS